MEDSKFITFQRFDFIEDAVELTSFLKEKEIEYRIDNMPPSLGASFGNPDAKEYLIKLKQEDFEKADELLLQLSSKLIETADSSHYLFDFTNEELKEIIVKKDEWSHFDYLLAQRILKERGEEINSEQIELHRKQRIEDLSKPESSQATWIFIGYFFAFLGGFLGIFIGWYLKTHRKTLPNGDRVFNYSQSDRRNGGRILFIGVASLILWCLVKIFYFTK